MVPGDIIRTWIVHFQLHGTLIYFPMSLLLRRGTKFITPVSSCNIASWVFTSNSDTTNPWALDCIGVSNESQFIHGSEHLVQVNDTIYVPIHSLAYFNKHILPNILVPVIIMCGQFILFADKDLSDDWENWFLPLYSNPNVLKVFCHNAKEYAKQLHPRMEPFPFGLKHQHYNKMLPTPLEIFCKCFFHLLQLPQKSISVFKGFVSTHTNPQREAMPRSPKLPLKQYYNHLAKSHYVLSPNGDQPEGYHHYEAIAFGAIPVTKLDPYHHRHLRDAPVIYHNTNWDITGPTTLQLLGLKHFPHVNCIMIFEEILDGVCGTDCRYTSSMVGPHCTKVLIFARFCTGSRVLNWPTTPIMNIS